MKISLNWLKTFIDTKKSPKIISEILTEIGLEVDSIEDYSIEQFKLNDLIIGEVKSLSKHPNAKNLKIAKIDIGKKKLNIICGAPNIKVKQKVVIAKPGSTIYPIKGGKVKINKVKIRGEYSEGMICSEQEIGIGSNEKGIIILKKNNIINGLKADKFLTQSNDVIFDISLTPNRADAASHMGVARDLNAVLKSTKINLPKDLPIIIENKKLKINVNVNNNNACPRYSGVLISDVKIKESPNWLKDNLISIGLSPINNVVDITNYILHSFGQPMHAFDYNKIKSKNIKVQFLKKGTKFITLDGIKRSLQKDDLMICDDNSPLCIAGVLGGESSEVTKKTTALFLESAYFLPENIRKSSQNHQITTDASFRFERGTDPNMTVYALKIAVKLIKEICQGKIASDIIDIYPKKINNTVLKVNVDRINRLIGSKISKKEIKNILKSLDINSKDINNKLIKVSIPPYRTDVKREADIIEEILRIHGYNKIKLSSYLGSRYLSKPSEAIKENDFIQKIMNVLVSSGYFEITTNSLTSTKYINNKNLWNKKESIEMINKLSEEHGVLKTNLLFTSLETIRYNLNRKQKNLKFFELDKIYKKNKSLYEETKKLGIYMVGKNLENHFNSQSRNLNINDLKDITHKVLQQSKINKYNQIEFSNSFFSYGIIIEKNNCEIAKIGEITQEIKNLFEIKEKVFFAEINWNEMYNFSKENVIYKNISKFPEVQRDLSLIIDNKIRFNEINKVVKNSNFNIIKKTNLYDIYQGENNNKNKKTYTIRFILQDDKETLSETKINEVMGKLMDAFIKELNAEIRK